MPYGWSWWTALCWYDAQACPSMQHECNVQHREHDDVHGLSWIRIHGSIGSNLGGIISQGMKFIHLKIKYLQLAICCRQGAFVLWNISLLRVIMSLAPLATLCFTTKLLRWECRTCYRNEFMKFIAWQHPGFEAFHLCAFTALPTHANMRGWREALELGSCVAQEEDQWKQRWHTSAIDMASEDSK